MTSIFRDGLGVGLILLMLGAVDPIRADVVFSNLGPNDDWDHHNSYVVDGPNAVGSPRPYAPAMPFTPAFTAMLTSIELPLGVSLVPGTNALVVGLLADADGLPGDPLEWYVFEDLPFVFSPVAPGRPPLSFFGCCQRKRDVTVHVCGSEPSSGRVSKGPVKVSRHEPSR